MREREDGWNLAWREKNIISSIPTTKMLDFFLKWFHMTRKVWLGWFFTLKVPKNQIWDREEIGFRVDFGFFTSFLRFWRLKIGLKRLLGWFIGVWGWKWIENEFLKKKHQPWFFSHCGGRNLGMISVWQPRQTQAAWVWSRSRPMTLGLEIVARSKLFGSGVVADPSILGLANTLGLTWLSNPSHLDLE
jgi:hypothetical protein